ncbi:hypothetical protein TrST_g12448 [Triparma strigata]|uniref:PX domain-containing protein n=1 Tax=Triparma strigata TaxID=1606541 RepID=A0A9W7EH78_9STRA|nr:hypothetical protein TrST_g12448 [Triparma strigata]
MSNPLPPVASVVIPPSAPPPPPVDQSPNASQKKYQNWKEAWDDARAVVAVDIAVLQTTVSEPEQTGSYMSKHITYLIRTEPYTYLVRRRYTDFVWLRDVLQKRYIGMLLPSLPPKTYQSTGSGSSSTSGLVKHRMRMLGIFLENLVQIPYVRGDPSVLAFLSVQNESEFDAAKTATAIPDLFSDTSAGAIKWRDALRSATIPHNGQRVLMDFINQLEYLEGHLKKLVAATKTLSERAIAKRASMDVLATVFQEWGKTEMEFSNSSKFEYPNKTGQVMAKLLSTSHDKLKGWSKVLSFEPTIIESVVFAALSFLQQQVDAFKSLIKIRDASIRDLEKSDKSLAQKKAEKDVGGDGDKPVSTGVFNFGAKGETLNEAIAREENEVRAKRRSVEAMARALFFSEIDRFNENRMEQLEAAMACLAASELMVSKKNAKLFAAFFGAMNLDAGEWSEKAKAVLSLQEQVEELQFDD